MDTIDYCYPEMSALMPAHEWECRICGALLELPGDGEPVTVCEECKENGGDDE